MNDDKKTGIPWSKIIIGIIIFVLFVLWRGEREENEQTKQEFAFQTAIAETQWADSVAATKQREDSIKRCIAPYEVGRYLKSPQCVVGFIGYSSDTAESKIYPNEPTFYFAYFSHIAEGFSLISEDDLSGYVNHCVMVWGDNFEHESLLIEKDVMGVNIEVLPDDACY